ncbi:MAG TPA: hypothetical protein VHM26_13750, partial [Chitinophagaceae bacterium]|nr:hypothetical protein [Chitinophagaceae bacterium]
MKRHHLLFALFVLLLQFLLQLSLSAQIQWFQNQDGNNPYPNGTVATSVSSFTKNSFIANYLWHIENDQFTWKISKSRMDGVEQKTFYLTGTTSQVDIRVGNRNTVYVLEKNYPFGGDPQYRLIKLDSNLNIKSERTISFPNSFAVFALNVFKIDEYDNCYLAGDGQYPDGPGFLPASFVMKSDRDLNIAWTKMDSTQTSYTDVQIDGSGYVWIIEDYYANFPNIKITKRAPNGHLKWRETIETDMGRFSLGTAVTEDDHLLLYGGKTNNETMQSIYLWKISRNNGCVTYRKNLFPANGIYLNDLKLDRSGNIFALVSQYFNPNKMVSKVGRISAWDGKLHWSRSFNYSQDSANLMKMVVTDNDKFYIVGEKRRNNILSRGFSVKLKKNGQLDATYVSPDSVRYLRSHWLIDGIVDKNNDLVSIGLTQDLDTVSYQSTYLRSFVVKLGRNNNNHHNNYYDCYDNYYGRDGSSAMIMEETPA